MFAFAQNRVGEAPGWIICSDVGGRTFIHAMRRLPGLDTAVWTANIDHALRFRTLGDVMEWIAFIPEQFQAYEEDPHFVDRHTI